MNKAGLLDGEFCLKTRYQTLYDYDKGKGK